jgi:hypothetical protein
MPLPDAPNIARVSLVVRKDTRTMINTFHVNHGASAWNAADMLTLATAFRDWWVNTYRSQVVTLCALTQVQVRKYDPLDPLAVDLALPVPAAGLQPTPSAASHATCSVSWRTGLAGRKYRGRFYAMGCTEAQIDDLDLFTSSYVVNMGAIAQALITAINVGVQELVVFHRTPVGIDPTWTKILSVVVENIVDSQRRRLPGRGR